MTRPISPTQTAPAAVPGAREATRCLLVPLFPEPGHPIALDGRMSVGRVDGGSDIPRADPRMSRRHFELSPTEYGAWRLTDLNSKNGTRLGGRAVQSTYVQDGAVIGAGDSLFAFAQLTVPPGVALEPPPGVALARAWAERQVDLAAPTTLPILINGPTGAGKERLARRVHDASGRPGPFVPVNCGALSAELVASELFGHVRGAFSGAGQQRTGLVRSADGGTLFLDEIGELPIGLQPNLLRVLQEGQVRPVGSDRTFTVDVRVVAATHQDLNAAVDAGRFRADLHARLDGLTVELPGLARRRADILPLLRGFLNTPMEIGLDAAEALLTYDWPRNVRGLQQVASRVKLFATQAGRLELGFLPTRLHPRASDASSGELDRAEVVRLLEIHGGRVAAVARSLGLSRQATYRRLEALGLDPAAYRG